MENTENGVIEFDQNIASLEAIVSETNKITAEDLKDKKQLKIVKETRIKLRDIRTSITKQGEKKKEGALKYQRDVLARQRELIAVITPEEDRLKDVEEEAKKMQQREENLKILPLRKSQLDFIKDGIVISDDEILDMDTQTFSEYYNGRMFEKNEIDRIAAEEKERKANREKELKEQKRIQEENRKLKEEADKKDAEREKERKVEEAKLAKLKAKFDKEKKEKEEAEEKIKKEKDIEEEKKKSEKAILRKKDFMKFLEDNGYTKENKENFVIKEDGENYLLFKKIAEFKK